LWEPGAFRGTPSPKTLDCKVTNIIFRSDERSHRSWEVIRSQGLGEASTKQWVIRAASHKVKANHHWTPPFLIQLPVVPFPCLLSLCCHQGPGQDKERQDGASFVGVTGDSTPQQGSFTSPALNLSDDNSPPASCGDLYPRCSSPPTPAACPRWAAGVQGTRNPQETFSVFGGQF
jgi:hypothetical protein